MVKNEATIIILSTFGRLLAVKLRQSLDMSYYMCLKSENNQAVLNELRSRICAARVSLALPASTDFDVTQQRQH